MSENEGTEAAKQDRTHILSFLYKMLDDNQGIIKYLDTKAGFGIAILGAIIGKIVFDQNQIVALLSQGPRTAIVFAAFGLFAILAAILGFLTVFPMINPAENVCYPSELDPQFFITEFDPKRIGRLFSSRPQYVRLKKTHSQYCRTLENATPAQIETVLAAEVLKLSFIRQLKIDRLTAFALFLSLTVITFVVLAFVTPKPPEKTQVSTASCSPVQVVCSCPSPPQPTRQLTKRK